MFLFAHQLQPSRATAPRGQTIKPFAHPTWLEYAGKEVKEFLLVPYFGACIHVPPPPANQIIHVLPARPVKVKTGMDAVWVEGVIQVGVARTEMGDAGYRLKAVRVEAYKER